MADTKISALAAATTPLAGTEVVPIVQGGVTVKATVASIATTTQPSGVANAIQYLDGSKNSSTSSRLTFDNSAYQTLTTQTYVNGGYVNARTAPSSGTYNTYDFVEGTTTTGYLRNYGSGFGAGATNQMRLWNTQNAEIVFGVNNAEVARLTTSGNLAFQSSKGLNFAANTPAAGMTSQLLNWYEEGTWGGVNASLNISSVALSSFTYTRVGRQVTLSGHITGDVTLSASTTYVILDTLPFPIGNYLTVAGSCHAQNNTAVGIALGNNANSIYVWFTATSGLLSGSQGFALTITYFI
jgi:hypothetical protein